ncbi:MAG: hypothetical protein M0R70_14300 [Nitrospirae bacterium]|nr:hypothetical protein [Nitrospirota bacterium]
MLKNSSAKTLAKKAKNGFKGYPVATIALYGPTDKMATKLVVGIVPREGADADQLQKWFSDGDIRKKPGVAEEVLQFIKENNAKSVAMTDRIIGCPHESGIDYPEGQSCPQCPFWVGRNRWTGVVEH